MNRSSIAATLIVSGVATASAWAYLTQQRTPEFADVIDVAAVLQTVQIPRRTCLEETAPHERRLRVSEPRCETIVESHERRVGYDVTYRLGNRQDMVRMEHRPGTQIPVRHGQLVLTPYAQLADNR